MYAELGYVVMSIKCVRFYQSVNIVNKLLTFFFCFVPSLFAHNNILQIEWQANVQHVWIVFMLVLATVRNGNLPTTITQFFICASTFLHLSLSGSRARSFWSQMYTIRQTHWQFKCDTIWKSLDVWFLWRFKQPYRYNIHTHIH